MITTKLTRIDASLFISLFISLYILFSMVSISLSQIFLAAALLFWLLLLIQKKAGRLFPGFGWPLLIYAVFSFLSSIFSVNPAISLKDSRELLLLLVVPIIFSGIQRKTPAVWTGIALLASGAICLSYSIYYYLVEAAPAERITGFMSHYMTQAGLLLLFSSVALARLFFSRDRLRLIWGLALPLAFFTLTLSLTRSAWIGVVVSLAVVLALYRPLSLLLIPVGIGLFFILSPGFIQQRALSIFGLKNYWNVQRLEYLRAGWEIIKDYPLLGTGPDTVDMVFQNPKYGLSEDTKRNVHLHNNIIQIAAERGLPTLLAWLAFLLTAFFGLVRLLKNKDPAIFAATAAALAALLGLVTAGFFEYNFGDSEVVTLFLYILTFPFLLRGLIEPQASTSD